MLNYLLLTDFNTRTLLDIAILFVILFMFINPYSEIKNN